MSLSTMIRLGLGLLIGTICIMFWLRIIDFSEIIVHISKIKVIYLIPAIIFYLSSYFLRSQRLRKLLSHKVNIPVLRNYAYCLAGNFLNYLIPIRAGEIAKCIFYKKNHDLNYAESIPSVLIDKLLDTLAIFVVLLLIPFTNIFITPALKLLLIILIIIFIISLVIIMLSYFFEKHIAITLNYICRFFKSKYKEKLYNSIKLFVEGLAIFKHNKRLIGPCIILTLMATLSDSLFFYLIFVAFGVEICFVYVILGYTLIFLSYILPHPPAQIGSNELLMLLIFTTGFGFEQNLVAAIMSTAHFLTAIVILFTGILSMMMTNFYTTRNE